MSPKVKTIVGVLVFIALVGLISRMASNDPQHGATVAPSPTASTTQAPTVPPAPVPTITVTAPAPPRVTVTASNPDCARLAELSTELIEAVFAYSMATQPTDVAINDALKGIASKDVQQINKAIETLNRVGENTSAPVNRIVELQAQLETMKERCHP